MKNLLFVIILSYLFFSCNSDIAEPSLFTLKDESIGISFQNTLQYTEELNPYTYRNFYNGGGVALGDINNDGSNLNDLIYVPTAGEIDLMNFSGNAGQQQTQKTCCSIMDLMMQVIVHGKIIFKHEKII